MRRSLGRVPWVLLCLLAAPAGASAADAGIGLRGCTLHDGLSHAAGLLLLTGRYGEGTALADALRDAGTDLVGARALWVPSDASADPDGTVQPVGDWLARFDADADSKLACGEARSGAGRLIVAAPVAGGLAPLDADAAVVRGWLAAGFSHAELSVVGADGALSRLQVTPGSLRRGVPLSAKLARPALVQLMATGPAGPRPVAQRVLPAAGGVDGPALSAGRGDVDAPASGRLNRLRSLERKPSVRRNRLLRDVARRHAHEICSTGRIGHLSRAGDDPEQRLREAGIEARLVGETVARAAGPGAAFDALGRSPSHLLTLLDHRFTDAGVATAKDTHGQTCLVVVLAAWPRFVGRIASRD